MDLCNKCLDMNFCNIDLSEYAVPLRIKTLGQELNKILKENWNGYFKLSLFSLSLKHTFAYLPYSMFHSETQKFLLCQGQVFKCLVL